MSDGGPVGDDQQWPARDAVDQVPGERRAEGTQALREEDGPGGGVAACQVLGPDAERQVQGAVAEARERVAGQQPAKAPVAQCAHHQPALVVRQRVANREQPHRPRTGGPLARVTQPVAVGGQTAR